MTSKLDDFNDWWDSLDNIVVKKEVNSVEVDKDGNINISITIQPIAPARYINIKCIMDQFDKATGDEIHIKKPMTPGPSTMFYSTPLGRDWYKEYFSNRWFKPEEKGGYIKSFDKITGKEFWKRKDDD